MRETVEGLSGLFVFRLAAALAGTMGILWVDGAAAPTKSAFA
jgi:hypothetical protein